MTFPLKFKYLLETTKKDIELPKTAWVTYAVCAVEQDSCTWRGWILESIKGENGELFADNDQICPKCGKQMFRTEVSIKMEPSKDQTSDLIPGKDYEVIPMEYEQLNSLPIPGFEFQTFFVPEVCGGWRSGGLAGLGAGVMQNDLGGADNPVVAFVIRVVIRDIPRFHLLAVVSRKLFKNVS